MSSHVGFGEISGGIKPIEVIRPISARRYEGLFPIGEEPHREHPVYGLSGSKREELKGGYPTNYNTQLN
jgi:hypothetical protein